MPSLFSGINLALRAMLAHQQSIQVIEHNVANANTPGYRRQEAVLGTTPAYPPPGLYRAILAGQVGTGVTVTQVRQFNLDFFDGRYRRELAASNQWESQRNALQQVEATLAETGGEGLVSKLDAFWAGWQTLSADPTNMTQRLNLRQNAESLASGLNQRAQALHNLRTDQDAAILQDVKDINTIAGHLAQLNVEIAHVFAVGDQPNDLLDERDRLLDNLAGLSGVTSSLQENGEVMVSIGGHALVVGSRAFALETAPDPANSNLTAITWADGQSFTPAGGQLAGLLEARDTKIPALLDSLDNVATTLISQVNALHQGGYGLNNATGLDFFTGSDALSFRESADMDDLSNIATAAGPDSPGDGSLAGQIAALQHDLLMSGGAATINQYYTDQAASLGLWIVQADTEAEGRGLVLDALTQQREAVSGVSLDEEAANLVKFQRAYQAAARLMTTLDEMLDRVINGMGVVGR